MKLIQYLPLEGYRWYIRINFIERRHRKGKKDLVREIFCWEQHLFVTTSSKSRKTTTNRRSFE